MAYRDSASAVEKLVAQVQTGAEKSALDYAESMTVIWKLLCRQRKPARAIM